MKLPLVGFAFLILSISGVSKAGVVLRYDNGTPSGSSNLGSNIFSITFTPTTQSTLDSLVLKIQNGGGSASDLSLKFSLISDLSSPFSTTSNTIATGGVNSYTYGLSGQLVSTSATTLYFGFSSASVGPSTNFNLGNQSGATLQGTWSTGASASNVFEFQLNATSVPEPSTIILTSSVLLCALGAALGRRLNLWPQNLERC